MSLYTADTCVFRVSLLNFLHEKQSSNIPRVQYSLHFPSSILFLILQVLLSLLLYRHIHRLCLVSLLGPAPNSKNIPSNTSDLSFYLTLFLRNFYFLCLLHHRNHSPFNSHNLRWWAHGILSFSASQPGTRSVHEDLPSGYL